VRPRSAGSRRAQARTAASLFAALGAQVGAFAVLVPDLAASRGLDLPALGGALAVMATVMVATLLGAGRVADRYGRRPLLLAGAAGFALAFAALAGIETPGALWPTLAVYGAASGCLDLGANAVGADYERAHGARAMVRLHAGFSAAAAAFALGAAGVAALAGHRAAYAAMAAGYALVAAVATRAPLPPRVTATVAPASRALLRIRGVALATAVCTLCFFGDGALEGFSAVLLRGEAGTVAAGASIAGFHAASLAGRLSFARVGSDATIFTTAGLLAAAAMTGFVTAGSPVLAGAALLVVGFALAPVVPTALSLAGRSAPGRAGAAVALVTTVGYSAFVLGPPAVGALAGATSLRLALGSVVLTMVAFALLGRRV
jgi:predicted MFS family arabinose efflux permease